VTSNIFFLDRLNKKILQSNGNVKNNVANYWDGAESIVTVENQSVVTYGEDSDYAVKVSFDPSLLTADECAEADAAWGGGWSTNATCRQTCAAYAIPVEALNLHLVNVTFDMKVDNMNADVTVYGVKIAPDGVEYVYETSANLSLKKANATDLGDGWYRYTLNATDFAADKTAAAKAADYFVFSLDNCQADYDITKASIAYIDNVTIEAAEHTHAYTEKGYDAENHWNECICGEVEENSSAAHETEYNSDAENHWGACECGYTTEKAAHVPGEEYGSNEDGHWTICGECGYEGESVAHAGEWKTVGEVGKDIKDVLTCECGEVINTVYLANVDAEGNEIVVDVNLNIEEAGQTTTAAINLMLALGETVINQTGTTGIAGLFFNDELVMTMDEIAANGFMIPATIFGNAYGEQELIFGLYTGSEEDGDLVQHDVVIKVNLITNVIETKEELDKFGAVAKSMEEDANTWGGYFQLGADIIYNATLQEMKSANVWTPFIYMSEAQLSEATGFIGTFDGCGHAIEGYVQYKSTGDYNAFITKVGEGGVIKNIAFTNAVIGGAGSLITAKNNGLLQNIYVHLYTYGAWSNTSGYFTNYNKGAAAVNAAIFNGANPWDASGIVENVFVNMLDSARPTADLDTNNNGWATGKSWVNEGETDAEPFGRTSDAVVNYLGVYAVGVSPYLANPVRGETIGEESGYMFDFFADSNSYAAAYNAAESAMAAEIATWPAWLKGYAIPAVTLEAQQSLNLDVQKTETGIAMSGKTVNVDLSEAGSEFGEIISVSYGAKTIKNAGINGSVVSIPATLFGYDYGETKVTIVTETGKYEVPVLLITKVLTSVSDVNDFGYIAAGVGNAETGLTDGKISNGYFTLGQNIAYNGTYVAWQARGAFAPLYWDTGVAQGFAGTFDGCGYTIDGMTAGTGYNPDGVVKGNAAFIPILHKDGIIRNVAFTNAGVSNSNTASGFLIAAGQGLIENVYVQMTSASGFSLAGVIFGTDNVRGVSGPTVRNVFVDTTAITTHYAGATFFAVGGNSNDKYNAAGEAVADGVADPFGIYDGVYAMVADNAEKDYVGNAFGKGGAVAGSTNYAAYTSAEAMKNDTAAQTEVATWNTTYWTIVEGVPTWNKK
ncbi:MAG: hypothetical protein J6B05_00550, partial [Clostridia bacterium]|nr:hypothetical protein [Clostridia bacterium]